MERAFWFIVYFCVLNTLQRNYCYSLFDTFKHFAHFSTLGTFHSYRKSIKFNKKLEIFFFSCWTHLEIHQVKCSVPYLQQPVYDSDGRIKFFPRIIGGQVARPGDVPGIVCGIFVFQWIFQHEILFLNSIWRATDFFYIKKKQNMNHSKRFNNMMKWYALISWLNFVRL